MHNPLAQNLAKPFEAARALGILPRLLWQRAHDGVIPCVRVGRAERRARRGKLPHVILPGGTIRFEWSSIVRLLRHVSPDVAERNGHAE